MAAALAVGLGATVGTWSGKASSATETALKRYVIHLRAASLSPSRIRVQGTTDLPDRAVIHLSGSRAFRNSGERDIRAVNAGGRDVIVSKGRFGAVLPLNEKFLLVGVGTSKLDDRIAEIDNAITACAQFQTGRDYSGKQYQPDARVRRIVGPRGQRLRGSPQITVFGSATPRPSNWLETTVRAPMSSPLISKIVAAQGTLPKSTHLAGFCLA
jgi:hypothetical protein